MKPLLNPVNNFEKSHMFSESFLHKKPLTRIFEHKHSWFRHQSAYKHLKAGNSLFIRRRDSIPKMLLFAAGDTAQGRFISDMFLQQVNSSSFVGLIASCLCSHKNLHLDNDAQTRRRCLQNCRLDHCRQRNDPLTTLR